MTDNKNIIFIFRPENSGLEKFLGKLEAEIMEIIWANGSMTVKRALYFINKRNKYAYTTVMTVMARLAEKGVLIREKEGHSYKYTPVLNKKKFLQNAVATIMDSLIGEFNPVTVKEFHRARKALAKK